MSGSGRIVTVQVPGDKSITHRALMLASLADGPSTLRNLLQGEDTAATGRALQALGCSLPPPGAWGRPVAVQGLGLQGLRPPSAPIDCANSGTTARLILGVLAGYAFPSTLDGDASLRRRPMRRVTEPLGRMGARFQELGEPGCLPVSVRGGQLKELEHHGQQASAQVKSALLLAGITGNASVHVTEPFLSRDHTERMLRAAGVHLSSGTDAEGRPWVHLQPPARLHPFDLTVPGDFSSAAFFLALGTLMDRGEVHLPAVGVNPSRTGFLEVARRMGAEIRVDNARTMGGEPLADLRVSPAQLRGVRIQAHEIPSLIDEIPALAMLAARATGETRIEGAAELRVKESDRLAVLAVNLQRLGVAVEENPDGLIIEGGRQPLQGAIQTQGDHRIAMAFAVLGAAPGADIQVDRPATVAVSFPGFWAAVRSVSGKVGSS